MPTEVTKTKWGASIWVPIVLIIGLVAGLGFLSLPSPVQHPFGRPPPEFETLENFGLILSTLNVALLVALLVIYARMYSDTGASFALGLSLSSARCSPRPSSDHLSCSVCLPSRPVVRRRFS